MSPASCRQPVRRIPVLAAALSWATSLASKLCSSTCSKPPAASRVRPTLEVLEDRTVPTNITYHGGPTIPHVQVNNIVMGPQPLDTTALMQALVRDYLPLLGPDYGIGVGTQRSSVTVPPLAGNPTSTQIQNFLVQEIESGVVPPPGPNQLYMVFLAPGQSVPDIAANSYHGYFFTVGIGTIYYAVIFGNPSQTSISASHELAEAATDPDGFTGYIDLSLDGGATGEVADIFQAQNLAFPLDGYQVAVLSGPQGQMIETPSPIQAAITLFLDGVYSVVDRLEGDSQALAGVNADIAFNFPYAGSFAELFLEAGEFWIVNQLPGGSNPVLLASLGLGL